MEELKYFIVQVKLEMETDVCDKAGNPKLKKWKETWCVRAQNTPMRLSEMSIMEH